MKKRKLIWGTTLLLLAASSGIFLIHNQIKNK